MSEINKAFAVNYGLSLDDEVGLFWGIEDPTSLGFDAPEACLYLYRPDTGLPKLYEKYGSNNTDWRLLPDEEQHRLLDTLVHNIAENSYQEITRTGNRVSSIIIWENNTKAKKIRENFYTYNGGLLSESVTKQYDENGVLLVTLVETLNRSGGLVQYSDVVIS